MSFNPSAASAAAGGRTQSFDEIQMMLNRLRNSQQQQQEEATPEPTPAQREAERLRRAALTPKERAEESFLQSVHTGKVSEVRDWIKNGVNVNYQNAYGEGALLLASRRGDDAIVDALLEAGANVKQRNKKGSTPLIAAAMKGNTHLCQLFVSRGADLNAETETQDTALSLATWQNATECALFLIRAGADVSHVDKYGDSLLLDAARHSNVPVMRELLDRRVDINHANKKGETALIRAVERGEITSVMLLLDRGADLTKVTKEKRNALIVASIVDARDVAKLLLARESCPLDQVDETGRSAMAHMAEFRPGPHGRQPYWDGVESLVKRGARLDKPTSCGDVLLCMASAAGVTSVVDCLLAAKANINFADPNNMRRTPLLANIVGKPREYATLRMLLARGADLDLADANGVTPLMQSISNNDPVMCQLIIDKGANLSPENKAGDNALAIALKAKDNKCQTTILNAAGADMGSGVLLLYAAQNNNLEQMKRVIEGKEVAQRTAVASPLPLPDVNFADRNGRTALMLAARAGHKTIVQYLLENGALSHLRDKDGISAMIFAIRAGRQDCAELIAALDPSSGVGGGNDGNADEYKATTSFLLRLSLKLFDTIEGLKEVDTLRARNAELESRFASLSAAFSTSPAPAKM